MKISVELDVFSGRPNPSWELTTSESEELLKQLSSLSEADKTKAAFDDGLGYRGFILTIPGADTANSSPSTIRIFKGTVLMNEQVFTDLNSVEKKLIEQARSKGFAEIIETMQIKE